MRAAPVGGLGGMYATGLSVDDVVRLSALVPSVAHNQVWHFKAATEDPDTEVFIILTDREHRDWRWSSIGEKPVPDAPVVLSTDPNRQIAWKVKRLDIGVKDAIAFIYTDPHLLGVKWYAGTENNQVIFKPFPIDAPEDVVPYWVLSDVELTE